MSRNPRGTCPGAGLTRTEQLRQAKVAAFMKDMAQKEVAKQHADAARARKRLASRPEPKKVDFHKPTMTKSMMARMKHAEKFKEDYERKQQALAGDRVPRRTAAPIGGDARMGKERLLVRQKSMPVTGTQRFAPPTARPVSPRVDLSVKRKSLETPISKRTTELAKVMNADVIQAEPVSDGPVTNIVIPPGVVNEDRTTIVNITAAPTAMETTSQVANRSIQVISETLDEQDAMENAAVNNKLAELQQARRDFVIAVANVGGNAVHIEDETPPSLLQDTPPLSPRAALLKMPPTTRHIVKVPDVEDKYLQPEYGQDHPDIVAARAYMAKVKADMEAREAARRMEDEFARLAAREQISENLQLDVPFEEELFLERDISWEEDEHGQLMPRPSRVKAHVPPVPAQQEVYQYSPFDPEELERFFNVQAFPPCSHCGPPPGRENLHPDLWELEDPWYIPPPCDAPDLIQFD